MSNVQPLAEYGQTILDANGNGALQIGPDKFNESWQIDVVTISVSTHVIEPQFKIYRGSSTAVTSLIGGSHSGSFDSDTSFNYTLNPQGQLTCVWSGGDVGAVATVVFHGKQIFA